MRKPLTPEQKEAEKIRNKEYYQKNKERLNKKHKEYIEENKENILIQKRLHYSINKERINNQKKEYYENNKEVLLEQKKLYRENNKDKIKQYFDDNKEELNEKKKVYRQENKDKITEYNREYVKINFEKVKETRKKYRDENKEIIQKIENKRRREKMKSDPKFRLSHMIRASIIKSFKRINCIKNNRTQEILGCSFEEFKLHIESKFEPWMTWDNQGNPKDGVLELNKTWDIDHIIPLSTAKTEEDIIRLNHYTNLQPLCSYVNRKIKRG